MSNEIVKVFKDAGIVVPKERIVKYNLLADKISGKSSSLALSEVGSNWSPKILKLVQPVTSDPTKPDTAKNGDYFHTGGLVKRPMHGLVVYAYATRVRFVQGVDKSPSCGSDNVDLKNRGDKDTSKSRYGDSCAKCPFHDQPFTAGKMTNCNTQMNVIVVPETLDDIYQMTFSKSGYSVGARLVDMLRATHMPWSRFYSFDSELKKRDGGGVYAVPTVTPVSDKAVEPDQAEFAKWVCDRYHEHREIIKAQTYQRAETVAQTVDSLEKNGAAVADTM